MSVFKEILVPVDYSGGAESALHHARLFAETFQARVDVLHVWRPPVTIPPEPGFHDRTYPPGETADSMAEREAERFLEMLFDRTEIGGDPRFRRFTESGSPTRIILRRAEAYDLVIMSTRGRRGLSRVMLGSVAEKVVRHVSCPVLVVHSKP